MSLEEDLKKKSEELETLQRDFDDFVESSKDIEAELETSLREAQDRIATIEKKQTDAENRNKELQETCNKLNRESNSVQTELEKLREKVSSLETSRRNLENDNEDLSNQVRILESSQEDLHQKLLDAEEDAVFLKNDIDDLKATKLELEAKLAEHLEEQERQKLERQQEVPVIERTVSSSSCFGVETFNDGEAEKLLSEKTRAVEELQDQISTMTARIAELENQNGDLQNQLTSTREDLDKIRDAQLTTDDLQKVIQQLTDELEAERAKVAQRDAQLEEFASAQRLLEEENATLQDLRVEIELMTAQKERLLEEQQQAHNTLRAEQESLLGTLRDELSIKTEEMERIRGALSESEQAFETHRESVVRTMEADIAKLKDELAREKESHGTVNSEKESILQKLEESKSLLEHKENEIQRLQSFHGEKQLELEVEKSRLSECYDKIIAELEKKLADVHLNLSELEQKGNKQDTEDTDVMVADLEEISELRQALTEKESECVAKQNEILQLQATIAQQHVPLQEDNSNSNEGDADGGGEGVAMSAGGDSDLSVASGRETYPSYNIAYPAIDSTTNNMRRLQQLLIKGTSDQLKQELRVLAGHCESLRASNVQLLNKIQSLRGNILVCCRTRPPNDNEINAGGNVIVDASDDSELLCLDAKSNTWKSFAFDKVWKAEANQADVFSDIEPLILSVTDGYNACIMAYGQTGSGKTYTMDGHDDQYGVTYRTIQKIFEVLENKKSRIYTSRLLEKEQRKRQAAIQKAVREAKAAAALKKRQAPVNSRADFSTTYNRYARPAANSDNQGSDAGSVSIPSRKPSLLPVHTSGTSPVVTSSSDEMVASDLELLDSQDDPDDSSVKSDLSDDFEDLDGHLKAQVEISMMEIYNEQVYDLLAEKTGGGQTDGVSCDARYVDGTIVVENLRQVQVQTMEEVMLVFAQGSSNRAVATTKMNERSSRSHLIVQVEVTLEEEGQSQICGKLYLVDLAGSERVNKSGATGTVMKEAQYINKSLLALGDVMEALDKKQPHIPFRNSKLTYILQNALGGNARTMMIVTVCPTDLTAEESLFALTFATRVRNITLSVAHKNSFSRNLEIAVKNLKMELKETKKTKRALEDQIRREKQRKQELTTGPLEAKLKQSEDVKKSLEIVVTELKRQLTDISSKYFEEKDSREKFRNDLEITQRNLKKALEQAKEHTRESERFSALLKNKERELEAMKASMVKHSSKSLSPEKQSSAFIQKPLPGSYHPRQVETEVSTPYHASKKSRFDGEEGGNIDSSAATTAAPLAAPELMGPPALPVLSEYGRSRVSKIPHTRYSSSSIPVGSGSKTSRVSMDRVAIGSSTLASSRNSLGPGSSLLVKKTPTSSTRPPASTPSSNVAKSAASALPASPTMRLEQPGPSTPTAPKAVRATTAPAAPAVPRVESKPPGSLVSRIPTLNSRSEEALKRHHLRMEKRRAEMSK